MTEVPKPKRIEDKELVRSYHTKRCVICRKYAPDPAHIKTRGSGGDDVPENILPLCRNHHSEQGQKGFKYMVTKYPLLVKQLAARGWEVKEVFGIWKLTKI